MTSLLNINSALSAMHIKAQCVNLKSHRHFAYYDLELDHSCSISSIESRLRELSLLLRSKTTPILKLIPENGIVRLQVANKAADPLSLDDMLRKVRIADNFNWVLQKDIVANRIIDRKYISGMIPIVLGETDEGNALSLDLAANPHTLIAGATGSGKSTMIHSIIRNIVFLNKNGLRKISLRISDPKGVDYLKYAKTNLVVSSYEDTIKMLEDVKDEMAERFSYMAEIGESELPHEDERIVVIIDEVADLILQDKTKKFENLLVSIAQKSRAAGIHFIAATQRPSVDVLTGLIKANFPARIACKVTSKIDSQVILDGPGAENLLGRGDAIIRSPVHEQVRFQVAI